MTAASATGLAATIRLLLAASAQRARGRRARQRELLSNRSDGKAFDWGVLGTMFSILLMAALHSVVAFAIVSAVKPSPGPQLAPQGKIIVSTRFLEEVRSFESKTRDKAQANSGSGPHYRTEAERIARRTGGDPRAIETMLADTIASSGSPGLVAREDVEPSLSRLSLAGSAGTVLGSGLVLWWALMLICQGEGLELDLQRRRHPMWEWLFSHPVRAEAVFLAEMLSPLSSNPSYWSAPLFAGILYGAAYDPLTGAAAALVVGVPVTIAAACASKALEIGALLRLAPRSRGAVIGLISWFGYAAMVLTFAGMVLVPRLLPVAAKWIDAAGIGPWPLLGWFLGMNADGDYSLMRGVLTCLAASALLATVAVIFSARSLRNGMAGAFPSDTSPSRPNRKAEFGREPLYRKEMLWFLRDRSAIVQAILIPITIAGVQLFNFRMFLEHAGDSWNYLCGAAILFGTYFLWVLGPKSLLSEGSALWIALTWPRGLENMLKAKAWLWTVISSALVMTVLVFACWLFPQDAWKVGLVSIGWFVFARSMADKSVTLVTVVSESGEATPVPAGRRWAAQLGMFTFAIGVCTQQWHLAIVGVVYSWITAAAMWENLRARLPYLYDPWSERLPDPPTLMHAMVSISVLVECAALVTGIVYGFGGRDSLGAAQGIGYAICAVGVWIGVSHFLSKRGVAPDQIWGWRDEEPQPERQEPWIRRYLAADVAAWRWLLLGLVGGILLGVLAHGYLLAIQLIPSVGESIRASQHQLRSNPDLFAAQAVMAIGFAPFAEEFLFRGMLYRTLDRHMGGWKAVGAAAAFFAIYHPALSWLPVAALGVANCLLFKRSKRLVPAVLLHMAYNSVVVFWGL